MRTRVAMSLPDPSLEAAYQIALRYLGHAPRSRAQIERRLTRGGFAPDIIAQVIDRLQSRGWVDDAQFARDWIDDRADRKRYGRRRLAQELRCRGVPAEQIEAALERLSPEAEIARALAALRARWEPQVLLQADPMSLRTEKQRIARFLQHRGFESDIITEALRQFLTPEE
ncbi:MAG: regulatory protein RecX [Chloroherpetonaceae bacterium]|nr:recombination regulator RecX [Chthonomonadaceae bacterium]MDW8207630.1 regulatory protein RecX [Chloroherpetonaceae bacterium]